MTSRIPWDQVPCIGHGELFFPSSSEPDMAAKTAQAKTICSTCPNTAPCLERAITRNENGIWGQTTGRERENLRRQRERERLRRVEQRRNAA